MKNLLIYINPLKNFDSETAVLVKVQIDNLLSLGWKPKDIMIVTNFDYTYQDIKTLVLGDENYCQHHPTVSKIYTIITLLKKGLIKSEIYWLHDFDGYQLHPVTKKSFKLGNADFALTDYGRMPNWSTGSIFFKKSSKDIMEWIKQTTDKYHTDEETALSMLTRQNFQEINSRIKKLNISYNFQRFNLVSNYFAATKPIKNVHFHPSPDKVDFFMYGKNKLNKILLPKRLIRIFNKHGIK